MTRDFLLRNSVSFVAGLLFGASAGYMVAVLGLGYGPMLVLILFGLVLLFAISAAAQTISGVLVRLAARLPHRLSGAVAFEQTGWHVRSRASVFLGAYAGGVVLSVQVPLDVLGKTIGGY